MPGLTQPSSYVTPTLSPPITSISHLPTTTVQSHASNLLPLPDGTLLCAFFGGTQEGISDISIFLSRLPPSTNTTRSTWTTPIQISTNSSRSEQNPVLFLSPSGTLYLFHTSQPLGDQDQSIIIARTSPDNGRTWSQPWTPFPDRKGVFVRQPVVVLRDGTWLLPIWYCRVPDGYRWVGSDDVSAVLYSRDHGKSWEESAVPDSLGCVHMGIVPVESGYAAFYRSRWADCVYRATSEDGITWSAPRKTGLRNPNAGIGVTALANGDLVIVFNDSAASLDSEKRPGLYDDIAPPEDTRANQPGAADGRTAVWGTPRSKLTVGLSKDGGLTWRTTILEDGDGWCMSNNSKDKANRELSYPSVAVVDGKPRGVHVSYTWHRQSIKYVCIEDVEEFVSM